MPSEYTVGKGAFTSIRAAMDAAVADGHNATNPAVVSLSSSVYADYIRTPSVAVLGWDLSGPNTYRASRGRAQGIIFKGRGVVRVVVWPTGRVKRRRMVECLSFGEAIRIAELFIEEIQNE